MSDEPQKPDVSIILARFAVSRDDVGDELVLAHRDGTVVTSDDPAEMIEVAKALAERDRCIYRVIRLSEFARISPAPAPVAGLS